VPFSNLFILKGLRTLWKNNGGGGYTQSFPKWNAKKVGLKEEKQLGFGT
jgi:hypothetical protein